MNYSEFIAAKSQADAYAGFEPIWLPSSLLDFQAPLCDWSIRKGRSLVSAACGMGKTLMELVCAENVVRYTNRPVLILTPLAVAQQTVREGRKFGIDCVRSNGGAPQPGARIIVSNIEKLHLFDPNDFGGALVDESAAIKAFNGKRRAAVTEFLRRLQYRSLWTALAAPNDYTELGTSSEALGYLGYTDMLSRFFKSDQNNVATGRGYMGSSNKWRFKGHAEVPFWRWACSWMRACRKPSDLGPFDDAAFTLPPLTEREHVVEARTLPPGHLFARPAVGLQEEREERRRTIQERCERVASMVSDTGQPAVVWCHLNDEGDLLERLIHGAKQIRGSQPDEEKEEIFEAFALGQLQKLVIKAVIGAWGLNWQHCNHAVTFASHSYEQYFQLVRRFWRFGQTREVAIDVVATEGERGALANLRRKAAAAERMFDALISNMHDAMHVARRVKRENQTEVPAWL